MIVFQDGGCFGDEGKGMTAFTLSRLLGAHTVVRTGGGQASSLLVSGNTKVQLSHFGGGTLAGARTFLSSQMVVVPIVLAREALRLINCGVNDPWSMMEIDAEALIATPWHIEANRLLEANRGKNRIGSTGLGIGEAVWDAKIGVALRYKDLLSPDLHDKLAHIKEHKHQQTAEIREYLDAEDPYIPNYPWRDFPELLDDFADLCRTIASRIRIVDGPAHLERLVKDERNLIFQSTQGAALNTRTGFHPHTSDTANPAAGKKLLDDIGYTGESTRLLLTRAYSHRHGAGPFVSENELLSGITDANNGWNDWQGKLRVGELDTVLLRYTIDSNGGPKAFDGLVVNCMDQLEAETVWCICSRYQMNGIDPNEAEKFFVIDDDSIIRIRAHTCSTDQEQFEYQRRLGELLGQCTPQFEYIDRYHDCYIERLEEKLRVPVVITAYGPDVADRKVEKNIWAKASTA